MSLEKNLRRKIRVSNLQNIILSTIAVAGFISVAAIAPNVLWAMKRIGLLSHKRQKESIYTARTRLVKRGLLEYNKNGMLRITPLGKKFLSIHTLLDQSKKRKPKWDKKWRILIFDIPEQRKSARNHIRYMLYTIGFKQLQKSVWIYPYDCEDLVTLIKADLKIGKDVLYIIAEALEYDKVIRKHFELK